jgi:hypothetical protein
MPTAKGRRRPSRAAVFLKSQNPQSDQPQHTASKPLLILLISQQLLKKVQNGYQLITPETWQEVKSRFRSAMEQAAAEAQAHVLAAPDSYHIPCLQAYPPVPRESGGRERQKQLWLSDAMIPARERSRV